VDARDAGLLAEYALLGVAGFRRGSPSRRRRVGLGLLGAV